MLLCADIFLIQTDTHTHTKEIEKRIYEDIYNKEYQRSFFHKGVEFLHIAEGWRSFKRPMKPTKIPQVQHYTQFKPKNLIHNVKRKNHLPLERQEKHINHAKKVLSECIQDFIARQYTVMKLHGI